LIPMVLAKKKNESTRCVSSETSILKCVGAGEKATEGQRNHAPAPRRRPGPCVTKAKKGTAKKKKPSAEEWENAVGHPIA